jgi:hypothetical protein
MTGIEFERALALIAELAAKKPPTKEVVDLYWSRCRHIDPGDLQRAFSVFGDRGIWPSIANILEECGHRPLPTRQEQADSLERERAIPRRDEADPEERPAWETNYGEWTFRAVGPQQTRDMERNLSEHGWTIIEQRTVDLVIETRAGKVLRRDPVKAVDFLCVRWKSPPTPKEIPPYLRGRNAMQIIEKLKERMKL